MTLADPDERELAELREPTNRIGAAAWRMTPLDGDLEQPPENLWDDIASEFGLAMESDADDSDDEQLAEVIPISGWKRYARPVLVAAAVIALVAVGVGTLVSTGDESAETSVLATAELEPLGESGSGSAELITTGDGELALAVDFSGVTAEDGFHEVWLLDPDVTKLVSLGPARSDGLYQVPSGLDPTVVPVVDVSFEIFDGDPSHGGNSVLRGVLEV